MADLRRDKFATGPKEIVLAVRPDTEFDVLVEQLKQILTLPKLPGFGGCSPCLSGLDRFVLQSGILERF